MCLLLTFLFFVYSCFIMQAFKWKAVWFLWPDAIEIAGNSSVSIDCWYHHQIHHGLRQNFISIETILYGWFHGIDQMHLYYDCVIMIFDSLEEYHCDSPFTYIYPAKQAHEYKLANIDFCVEVPCVGVRQHAHTTTNNAAVEACFWLSIWIDY